MQQMQAPEAQAPQHSSTAEAAQETARLPPSSPLPETIAAAAVKPVKAKKAWINNPSVDDHDAQQPAPKQVQPPAQVPLQSSHPPSSSLEADIVGLKAEIVGLNGEVERLKGFLECAGLIVRRVRCLTLLMMLSLKRWPTWGPT